MSNRNVHTSLGLFASTLGNLSVVTCGVDAKRTVAIQCRSGMSPGGFFVFDGPLDPGDRCEGMKLAFGGYVEIRKPDRQGDLTHEALDAVAYNKLLVNVDKRRLARERQPVHELPANDSLRYHRMGPLWDWSMTQKFSPLLSSLYAAFALGPLPVLTIVKIVMGQSLIPDLVYLIFFLLLKWYCRRVLDIRRDVRYIMVTRNQLEPADQHRWETLWQSSRIGAPGDGAEAVEDIKYGHTRLLQAEGTYNLLVPVMSLEPTLSFDRAQWWFIARRLRGPLLTSSYLFPGSSDHRFSVAFAICAFVQACLQDDASRVFLSNTNTYNVNWFRRVKGHPYPEEYEAYHKTLR